MDHTVKKVSNAADSWLQILLNSISAVVISMIIYYAAVQVRIADNYPNMISLVPDKLFELGGPAAEVNVGMYLRGFPQFDMVKGEFVVDMTVWFRFDPHRVSLDQIGKFTIDRAEVKLKSDPFVKVDGENLIAYYDMRVQIGMSMNYEDFPIDNHRLNFVIGNNFLSPAQVFFDTTRNNIAITSGLHVEGWQLYDKSSAAGYNETIMDVDGTIYDTYTPRVIFSFDFVRSSTRHLISIFLPLLIIFFIGLFSFSVEIDPKAVSPVYDVVTMSAATVTALVAYKFVIEAISPSVGYFMISDYIFFYFIMATMLVLGINIFSDRIAHYQKNCILTLFHLATIIVFFYLLNPWE